MSPLLPVPVELVLYVSPESLPCARARHTMEQLLRRYDASQVDFRVCDLTREPDAAIRDRVIFTPTLVKCRPLPAVWVLGDLAATDVVINLLEMCGVSPSRT